MRSLQLATTLGQTPSDPVDLADLAEADALEAEATAKHARAHAIRARVAARSKAPAPIATAQPLHTRQQTAAALGCSLATLDRECRTGAIPFVIVGDSRRFDMVQVRAALAARTETPAPAPRPAPQLEAAPAVPGVRRVSVGGSRGAR